MFTLRTDLNSHSRNFHVLQSRRGLLGCDGQLPAAVSNESGSQRVILIQTRL